MSRASSACLLPRVLTLLVRVGSADRKPCMKAVPGWMGRAGRKMCNVKSVLSRVEKKQGKYDERCLENFKDCNFVVGDWVRTRLWQGTKKGLSKWSEPKQVVKVKKYSVVLNDGRKWNMVDVVKCWAKEVEKWEKQVQMGDGHADMCLRKGSQRVTKRPEYLKDYHTE
ncbi:hypothetical protein NDU88_007373 [Pleurodeles waltl]|uniref:Uncharacterized protein n=1 Tax=Pleurodeles waltl TaxID=8319 RepID=A0AAV7TZK1_PLEWA|nr:hypothetical protein NDU88_007373 [Pleurodeles waltl]